MVKGKTGSKKDFSLQWCFHCYFP